MTTAVLEKTVVDTAQTISQAYRFELDPTREQISALNSHIGGARACYNKLLGLVTENWDENRVKKAAGAEVAREDYLGTYHLDLQKLWYTHRAEMAPWYQENGSSIYNYACLNLSKSFANWRAGRTGFPTFKHKGQSGSASLLSGAVGLTDTHHVRISRIGPVKTYESMRKIYRHLGRGTGRITSATISRRGGKYFISFTLEVQRQAPPTRTPEKIIGIDAGLTTLYTGATRGGEEVLRVENPRNY